jgi:capsular exopolysaccharide synthesis family protein
MWRSVLAFGCSFPYRKPESGHLKCERSLTLSAEQSKQNSLVALTLSPEVSPYFHNLRDRVLSALGERAPAGHAIVVTSCRSSEGVSAVTLNLALVLSEVGEQGRVLLCDANPDSPLVHKLFQVDQSPGLAEVAAGQRDLKAAVRSTGIQALDILPVGGAGTSLSEVADSPRLGTFLTAAREAYRVVVFDTAPVIECTAAARLAALADGAILVIEAERQRREAAQRATDLLTDAGARILGAVLNKRRYYIPEFLYNRL